MSTLASLKKKRGSNLKKLQEKLESAQSGGYGPRDERIWKPKFNAEKGKGTAIVRFLPAKDGDPFVEVMTYSFNGPGGNFFDNARQTIGEDDPVQIAAISAFRQAKADGDQQLRSKAMKLLPRRTYYANIFVVRDEENPDNEGKVFIYQFGPAIYNKVKAVIQPEFDDVDPMDPFDLWEGANFKIRMVGTEIPDSRTGKKITVPNYDNSEFDRISEFMDGDEDELDKIFQQTYDLSEFIAPEKFKSYDEVAELFKKVMGHSHKWLSEGGSEDHVEETQREERKQPKDDPEPEVKEQTAPDMEDDDEDPVAKFKRLAGQL